MLFNTETKILDHGFIKLLALMGEDKVVVQAARQSYGDETKTVNDDVGLINYLLRHKHTTPFEMCEMQIQIKMPIFVARQWIRHRTANVNEYSGRYSKMLKDFYVPEVEQITTQSKTNNQGRSDTVIFDAVKAQEVIRTNSKMCWDEYEELLEMDVSRELARLVLPVNFYTLLTWKIDVHNLMHFLTLRDDSHAQYEIRVYAEVMARIFKDWMPITYEAYEQYRKESKTFSKKSLEVLKQLVSNTQISKADKPENFSKGEWLELLNELKTLNVEITE